MRLNQPQDRMPPLHAPIPTNMVVSVSIRTGSLGAHDRQTPSADDVSGLLIAALTASAHAIGRGSEGGCCTCDAVLLQPPT